MLWEYENIFRGALYPLITGTFSEADDGIKVQLSTKTNGFGKLVLVALIAIPFLLILIKEGFSLKGICSHLDLGLAAVVLIAFLAIGLVIRLEKKIFKEEITALLSDLSLENSSA